MSTNTTTDVNGRSETLVLIKPDGVRRGLVGKIVTEFENKGFELYNFTMCLPTTGQVKLHYPEHVMKPYFPRILKYMTSGKVVVFVIKHYNCVENVRKMLGKTDPLQSEPHTLRSKYAVAFQENTIHASATDTEFTHEKSIWFPTK